MAQEEMAPPAEGAAPQEASGGGAEAVMGIVQTVDEGLTMLNEVAAQLPIGDAQKQKLAQVQVAFQEVLQEIMGGQASQPGQSQAPMEQGAGGQPMNPSIRS